MDGYLLRKRRRGDESQCKGDESYALLLELCMQEPMVQSCIKIVQSTCLAQGITIKVKGRHASASFDAFVERYYVPFAEEAIRHFFGLGFVPWRLRKIPTGDSVPEVIPLGLFTWRIDSAPNRPDSYGIRDMHGRSSDMSRRMLETPEQLQASVAFEKQKAFFERKPANGAQEKNTAAYHRQKRAMDRFRTYLYGGKLPSDADESKLLRYQISFTENCGLMEDEVEIYEFVPPSNNVTRMSAMYCSVPSPLAHLLVDYRNMRQAQIRQSYADAFNLQAKMICSYTPAKTKDFENGTTENSASRRAGAVDPTVDSNAWGVQRRGGSLLDDMLLPTDMTANAFSRDLLTQTMVDSKVADHVPVVYTLPKNTTLEAPGKLESIVDVAQLQVHFPLA